MSQLRKKGILYLIPTNLSEPFSPAQILPQQVIATTLRLNNFIAENAKVTRAFLKAAGVTRPMAEISIVELDKHAGTASPSNIDDMLIPLIDGIDVGLVSDAGAPAIADPGALVVAAAHRNDIMVRPLVGASSILLGLMASGLNGQSFAFHGYLAQDKMARKIAIQTLERESTLKHMTQLFIETPYRNQALIEDLLTHLLPNTKLCVASDLTGEHEQVRTKLVSHWRKTPPLLEKRPTLFLFLA
jgi:16S rRNA (cytidine1402-2'-O)-methyltransferase